MLKSLKNMISSTHDQLSNVIYKTTQNCYQQHHYCHNDLIYRCTIKSKNNRPSKSRNRNRKCNRTTNKQKRITTNKQRNSSKTCIEFTDSIQNNYENSTTKRATNSLSETCVCACECRVNLKIFHQLYNYRKDVCIYIEEKLITFQLVVVIILLALITCTAQNIDTQVKSQQKPTTSQTILVTTFKDAASATSISFNNTLHNVYCHHQNPNILNLLAGKENNFKYPTKISHNLSYHNYFRNEPSHMQFITRKIFSEWTTHNKTNSWNRLNAAETHYYQRRSHDDSHSKDYKDPSDSSIVLSTTQINNENNTHPNAIKVTNKSAKDGQKHHNEIQNSTLIFFKNKYYIKSLSYTTNYNKLTYKTKQKVESIHDKFNDHADEHVQIRDFRRKFNLLTTSTNRSLQFVNGQQHVDHEELIKVVLDGLGLQKVPNMENANISQLEYVTKYREYLQRMRSRKRRDLREPEESSFRPLDILSIANKRTLPNQSRILRRQKRNSSAGAHENLKQNHQNQEVENDKTRSLEERVRNILFLKKKYQRPRSTKEERDARKSNIRLMFALRPEILNLKSNDIEEANIRLILIHSPTLAIKNSKKKKLYTKPRSSSCGLNKHQDQKRPREQNVLNLKLFFLPARGKRVLLDGRKIDIKVHHNTPDETHTQWLQFDVTKAVKTSIDEGRLNHIALELQCDNCKRLGARILNDAYNTADDALAHDNSTDDHQLMPVLNIIGHFDQTQRSVRTHQYEHQNSETNEEVTNHRHYHHQTYNNNNNNNNNHNRRTNCYKANQRCCRHSMQVTFKEIKGFEFIIQPKVFDAGYCHGRCPPRYNPAHHHALLQSLIWKQDHRKSPRPCCAPSKLVELEVLHVDEKDSNKLKISTWSDMKVVECACS